MTASITCPECGRTSYNPGDIENRYCAACDKFHVRMFYRIIIHVATIDPLRIHATNLEMDAEGNYEGLEPFVARVIDDSFPAHATPGDMWFAYVNTESFHKHGDRNRIQLRNIEPMPYFGYDPEDELTKALGPISYTYQFRPEKQVGLRWVPSNDIILDDFNEDSQAIEAAKVYFCGTDFTVVYVKRQNEPEVLGWWWKDDTGGVHWAEGSS